ncbi:hypothetical protein SYK_20570 [Pseudodesulfovibrio nedwellii]|uniref:Transposase n=1 Tax=Pseudodesulfovibrio nedwellii TaxID=2973072 RepID=A0ABN6S6H2_9BACT|nr:hypothetical protein SYK_20570 [Pseudodesulfovibrio nedwellii]
MILGIDICPDERYMRLLVVREGAMRKKGFVYPRVFVFVMLSHNPVAFKFHPGSEWIV